MTGGVAYGKVETNVTHVQGIGNIIAATSGTKTGATFGAGAEAPLAGNWTAKIEYLHINFGTQSLQFGPTPNIGGTIVTTSIRENIYRAGLNYRFDWGPVIAKF